MGSKIDTIKISKSLLFNHQRYISGAVRAARKCLNENVSDKKQLGMLISTAVYRDKHIVEPALSSLILGQLLKKSLFDKNFLSNRFKNVLTFDLNNGASGLIQAIQIIDGFIQSENIKSGLVIAGDSNYHTGDNTYYPFNHAAAAILLSQCEQGKGFVRFKTDCYPQYKDDLIGYGHFSDGRLKLSIDENKSFLDHAIECAQLSYENFLKEEHLTHEDIDLVFCSQYPNGFVDQMNKRMNLDNKFIKLKNNNRKQHTSAPLIALHSLFNTNRFKSAKKIIFLTVGSGITVSIALYNQ